jgi:non-heme chloroperoxidase
MQATYPLQQIDLDDTSLAYVDAGQGLPVILVHGSVSDYRTWIPQIETFSRRYRVIAYSRRYHYPNSSSTEPNYSTALHARDLAMLIDRLQLGAVHLVGASYGAYVALYLAANQPEFVRSLVLGEPPIFPWLAHIPGARDLYYEFGADTWQPAEQAFKAGLIEAGTRGFVDGIFNKGTFDSIPLTARQAILDNSAALAQEATSPNYFSPFSCEDVQKITMPTLLLTGEHSKRMFHLITEEIARCLFSSEQSVIPAASHIINASNPALYNEVVLKFLSRN